MDTFIYGVIYCLNSVIKFADFEGAIYLLLGNWERDRVISFGRNRELKVSRECYIVRSKEDDFEIEPVVFDSNGHCDYLEHLKEENIAYEIPKSLPKSKNRFTRFENAIGATYCDPRCRGYYGKYGFALTKAGYIGDDEYEKFIIDMYHHPGTLCIGDNKIVRMKGFGSPNEPFLERLLMEGIKVQEGEDLVAMFEEAWLMDYVEHIEFEALDED